MRAAVAAALAAVVACASVAVPAKAARPLADGGRWDHVFALFARDVAVPWKRISVRLDTYSGAPVDFAAYNVDPADVLVAGAQQRPRAIDTSKRKPVARWRFTPPPGLTYEINDVEVPLGNRPGFYVVEARRGDAAQQVWVDVTRVGLVIKEAPGGITLYGCDLGTGKALGGMRVEALIGAQLTTVKTDVHGIVRFGGERRPRFALAEWGDSVAFASFSPSSPVPAGVVGVRLDRTSVRAGERVRAVGYARKRVGNAYRPAVGDVHLTLVARGRVLTAAIAHLDAAGAFVADLAAPAGATPGDASVLATVAGASGGAPIRLEGTGDIALHVAAGCTTACAPDAEVPLTVSAKRAGSPAVDAQVRVQVVRSPHLAAPGETDVAARWGTTPVVDRVLRTNSAGVATVSIPAPTDGLASTYGVEATSGASTAATRIVAPTGRVGLAIVPERTALDPGESAAFEVRGFDTVDGAPAKALAITVRLVHGPTVQEAGAKLDDDGRTRVVFRNVAPGTQIVTAETDVDGKHVVDATAVAVTPGAFGGAASRRSAEVTIATDQPRYRVGSHVAVSAALPGSVGDAFVSIDGARSLGDAVVPVTDGRANVALTLPESIGEASVAVAFVRDGAIEFGTRRLAVDEPGHARTLTLHAAQSTFAPGSIARVQLDTGGESGGATVALRVGETAPVDGTRFEDVANALTAAATTTQTTAALEPAWHGSVAPQRSTATDVFAQEKPRANQTASTLASTDAVPLVWRVERSSSDAFDVTLPAKPGRYTVSVLKIGDDGDVGAATMALVVK